MNNRENFAYTICFAIGLAGWIVCGFMFMATLPKKPVKPPIVVNVCSGCGAEWHSYEGTRTRPIKKCPNCPMSEEEFEALKEAIRNRHKGDER